jgi:hypothetical protein
MWTLFMNLQGIMVSKGNQSWDWRDGSVVKSTEVPRFSSQHLRGSSQPSIIPVPGDLKPSSDLCRYWAWKQYTNINAYKTHTQEHLKGKRLIKLQLYGSTWENNFFIQNLFLIGYFLYLHFKCYPLSWFPPRQKKSYPILPPPASMRLLSWFPPPTHPLPPSCPGIPGASSLPRTIREASPPIDAWQGHPLLHMQLEPWVPPCVLFWLVV